MLVHGGVDGAAATVTPAVPVPGDTGHAESHVQGADGSCCPCRVLPSPGSPLVPPQLETPPEGPDLKPALCWCLGLCWLRHSSVLLLSAWQKGPGKAPSAHPCSGAGPDPSLPLGPGSKGFRRSRSGALGTTGPLGTAMSFTSTWCQGPPCAHVMVLGLELSRKHNGSMCA